MKRLEKGQNTHHHSKALAPHKAAGPRFMKHAAAVIFTTLMVESAAAQETLKESLKTYLPEYFVQEILQKNTPEKIKNTISYTKTQNMTEEETADYLVGELVSLDTTDLGPTQVGNNIMTEESSKIQQEIDNIPPETINQMPKTMTSIIDEASKIIQTREFGKRLMNPYIIGSLYYSDNFYNKVNEKDEPTIEIMRALKGEIDTQTRKEFFKYLVNKSIVVQGNTQSSPIASKIDFPTDQQMEENHQDAIDIFQEEGSPVQSICSGIVIVAESGRDPENKLSTSSYLGGNTVIIFDPMTYECYRYAHLKDVYVKTGDLIKNGTEIGTIGHTGKNAQEAGHGKHIHLEINKILPEKTDSTNAHTLKQKLQEIEKGKN